MYSLVGTHHFGDNWSFMGAIGLHAKLSANVISGLH